MLADVAGRARDERSLAAGRAAAGTFSWIPGLGCASVAAVRGHAYGAGLQLALACDFRIFAEGTKVGLPETRYGLLPDMGATVRLPRIVGESRARELILLGEVIDAAEALRIGLANRVVPGEDLDTAAAGFAGAPGRPAADRGAGRPAGDRRGMAPRSRGELPGGPGRADPLPAVRGLQGGPPGDGRRPGPALAGPLGTDDPGAAARPAPSGPSRLRRAVRPGPGSGRPGLRRCAC